MELITKYRPINFDQVIGQDKAVKALRGVVKNESSKTFLFTGPSGVGKTTLARIVAHEIGCESEDVTEIDAATNTGIDAMRTICEQARYVPFSGSGKRAIIIDEAHSLSAAAWKSLLKILEEPPAHLYWFLCTTELAKVPPTVKTRCALFQLEEVGRDDLTELVEAVCELEEFKVTDEVVRVIVKAAKGSPRAALSHLSVCSGVTSSEEAADLLNQPHESAGVSELCQTLLKGRHTATWVTVIEKAKPLLDKDPESSRMAITGYLGQVLRNTKRDEDAVKVAAILDCFAHPYGYATQPYPLLLSLAKVLYSDD